jgi:dTDP-glucose pyrophosphorylase
MAGLGSRFKLENFETPKPLIRVDGKSLVEHSVDSLNIEGDYIFVTRKFEYEQHNRELSDLLQQLKPGSLEICLGYPTRGASETCLAAVAQINNDDELIITNCDQILHWNSEAFLRFSRASDVDGSVLTFESNDPRHSYADVNGDMFISRLREKQVISKHALVGLHYWRRGRDFVAAAEQQIKRYTQPSSAECYISETYNILIEQGLRIKAIHTSASSYTPLGTPKDVARYLGKLREFYQEKPKTIFCDLDGTILKHRHRFSLVCETDPELLAGVRAKFDEWDSQGHVIVLCTARKESSRQLTEKQLSSLGISWTHLLMGLTSGQRILVNDKLNAMDDDRAVAVNLLTDVGFDSIAWEKYGL